MSNCYFNIRVKKFHIMWIRGNFIPGIFVNRYWKKDWPSFHVLDWPGKRN